MASQFASFGQGQPVGAPGPTTGQILGKKGLLGYLAGGAIQNSTAPFSGGGNVSPNNLPGGLNLGKGQKSLGINAKSPDQNVTTPSNTIPSNQVSPSQGNSGSSLQSNPPAQPVKPFVPQHTNPAAFSYNGGVNGVGQTYPGFNPSTMGANGGNSGTGTTGYGGTVPTALSALFSAANNQNAIDAINKQEQQQLGDIQNQAGLGTTLQGGRSGQIENIAQNAISNLLTSRGQQIGAAESALGAVAPTTVPYSTQYISPATGLPVSAGGGGGAYSLPTDAQTLVNTLAQQVQNGQMTYDQAVSNLSIYGPAGISALTQALGPNFNVNASTASAATTQAGQQIQTAMNSANQSLTTLQNLYQSLPGFSQSGIPGLNQFSNSIESMLGSSQLSSYKAALSDARAQLEGVLTATGSATPTDAASMASTYLPDNMTPSQLASNIQTVQSLMQQKASAFTSSGATTNSGSSGSVVTNSNGQVTSASF